MSIDDRLLELQDAIWKRLGKGSFLRPTGLLEKLGKDLGIHPDDVQRGFIRLKEQGWLGNVASNGIPLGQVSILAPKPAEAEPASLLAWRSALQRCALDEESKADNTFGDCWIVSRDVGTFGCWIWPLAKRA